MERICGEEPIIVEEHDTSIFNVSLFCNPISITILFNNVLGGIKVIVWLYVHLWSHLVPIHVQTIIFDRLCSWQGYNACISQFRTEYRNRRFRIGGLNIYMTYYEVQKSSLWWYWYSTQGEAMCDLWRRYKLHHVVLTNKCRRVPIYMVSLNRSGCK